VRSPQAGERQRVGPGWRGTDDYVFSTSSPHPAPPAHPAPLAAISLLIAAKRQACGKPGNQFGVSPTYRNYCQPATGTASANCRQGTRTKMSSIYRYRTPLSPLQAAVSPHRPFEPTSGFFRIIAF